MRGTICGHLRMATPEWVGSSDPDLPHPRTKCTRGSSGALRWIAGSDPAHVATVGAIRAAPVTKFGFIRVASDGPISRAAALLVETG